MYNCYFSACGITGMVYRSGMLLHTSDIYQMIAYLLGEIAETYQSKQTPGAHVIEYGDFAGSFLSNRETARRAKAYYLSTITTL